MIHNYIIHITHDTLYQTIHYTTRYIIPHDTYYPRYILPTIHITHDTYYPRYITSMDAYTTAAAAGDQTHGPFSYNIKKRNYQHLYSQNPYMLLLYNHEQKKQRIARPITPPLSANMHNSYTQTTTTRSNRDDEHKQHD